MTKITRIILADAAHDENGKDGYEGSRPGDQTGDEVRNIFYSKMSGFWNTPETCVFRCKRADLRDAIRIRVQQTVDNSHIGYSQPNRKTYWEQIKNDFDPSHIRTDVECDCSCLINTCVWATLKSVNSADADKCNALARTIQMPEMYRNLYDFEEVTKEIDFATGEGLQRGDILVIPNKHTAIVWDVVTETVPDYNAIVNTQAYIRIGASLLLPKCNVQCPPDYKIRNYVYKGEKVVVTGESGEWYRLEMRGDNATWYPWCRKRYIDMI